MVFIEVLLERLASRRRDRRVRLAKGILPWLIEQERHAAVRSRRITSALMRDDRVRDSPVSGYGFARRLTNLSPVPACGRPAIVAVYGSHRAGGVSNGWIELCRAGSVIRAGVGSLAASAELGCWAENL
jgi:hypothetical protein